MQKISRIVELALLFLKFFGRAHVFYQTTIDFNMMTFFHLLFCSQISIFGDWICLFYVFYVHLEFFQLSDILSSLLLCSLMVSSIVPLQQMSHLIHVKWNLKTLTSRIMVLLRSQFKTDQHRSFRRLSLSEVMAPHS